MGGCKCKNNFLNNSGGTPSGCQACSTINENKTHDGLGGCKCKNRYFEGQHPVDNVLTCLLCPDLIANQIYNLASNSCICKNNYIRDPDSTDCIFCNDFRTNSQGDGNQGCKCKNNYHLEDNQCKFCNTTYPNTKGDGDGGC